jgi:hypothetical protein
LEKIKYAKYQSVRIIKALNSGESLTDNTEGYGNQSVIDKHVSEDEATSKPGVSSTPNETATKAPQPLPSKPEFVSLVLC